MVSRTTHKSDPKHVITFTVNAGVNILTSYWGQDGGYQSVFVSVFAVAVIYFK